MKLTTAQITTVRFALQQYAEKYQSRAEAFPDGGFWQEEVAAAQALETLFTDALNVEVESVQLEPAVAPAAPAAPVLIAEHGKAEIPANVEVPQRFPIKPPLLMALESAQTTIDRREILRCSAAADKRALARFLKIPANDLMDWATTYRMRPALQAAA